MWYYCWVLLTCRGCCSPGVGLCPLFLPGSKPGVFLIFSIHFQTVCSQFSWWDAITNVCRMTKTHPKCELYCGFRVWAVLTGDLSPGFGCNCCFLEVSWLVQSPCHGISMYLRGLCWFLVHAQHLAVWSVTKHFIGVISCGHHFVVFPMIYFGVSVPFLLLRVRPWHCSADQAGSVNFAFLALKTGQVYQSHLFPSVASQCLLLTAFGKELSSAFFPELFLPLKNSSAV